MALCIEQHGFVAVAVPPRREETRLPACAQHCGLCRTEPGGSSQAAGTGQEVTAPNGPARGRG
jgi:hypothetical protein